MTSTDDLRATLARHAADTTGTLPATTRASLVERRARRDRSRRRAAVGAGLATVVVVAVAVVGLPGGGTDPVAPAAPPSASVSPSVSPSARTGPRDFPVTIAGQEYPPTLVIDGVTYRRWTSYIAADHPGSRTLRVATVPSDPDQALAWSSAAGVPVVVTVDATSRFVRTTTSGGPTSGIVIRGGRAHTITIRPQHAGGGDPRMALVTYRR